LPTRPDGKLVGATDCGRRPLRGVCLAIGRSHWPGSIWDRQLCGLCNCRRSVAVAAGLETVVGAAFVMSFCSGLMAIRFPPTQWALPEQKGEPMADESIKDTTLLIISERGNQFVPNLRAQIELAAGRACSSRCLVSECLCPCSKRESWGQDQY